MARWLIELVGDLLDLEDFPEWFPDGDIFVVREGEHFYLTGSAFENCSDASSVRDAAIQVVEEFSSIGSLLWPELIKPGIGSIVREEDGKRLKHHVLVAEAGRIRMKGRAVVLRVSGQPDSIERPTQAQHLLAASHKNRHLGAATMLWADSPKSWPRLYRILEEIESFLGANVDKAGLCSASERERFARTANNAEVAGKDARHGSGKFDAPKIPMSLAEATGFIGGLLQKALRS